jgi:hypothetical protein
VGGVLDRRVAADDDDAEERPSGSMILDSSDLELVRDSDLQTVGLRFTSITIPAGATITRAYVQFRVDERTTDTTVLAIAGQASDNALIFTRNSRNISSRPRTASPVSWTVPAWSTTGVAGLTQRTPDLSSIIQQIVNRPGWNSGQAIAIIITGSGRRTAEAFEGDEAGAPLLHVEYGY